MRLVCVQLCALYFVQCVPFVLCTMRFVPCTLYLVPSVKAVVKSRVNCGDYAEEEGTPYHIPAFHLRHSGCWLYGRVYFEAGDQRSLSLLVRWLCGVSLLQGRECAQRDFAVYTLKQRRGQQQPSVPCRLCVTVNAEVLRLWCLCFVWCWLA